MHMLKDAKNSAFLDQFIFIFFQRGIPSEH
jgi:hypothetical protein